MKTDWHAVLARCSTAGVATLVAALIAIVAFADYLTGPHLSFSIFYVLPVALASWYAPRRITVLTCLVATTTWLTVEISSMVYENTFIPLWNAAVRLGFFAITSALLVALKAALQRQEVLANVDGLTQVLNRRAFEQRCEYLFRLCERQSRTVSIGYLDIDRFKQANDEFGHQMGDRILVGIAATLTRELRSTDLVGRIGGDEFAIALPDAKYSGATFKLQRILTKLRRAAASNHWPVGFSVGVVVCCPPLPNVFDALHHADRLMYRVKSRDSDGFIIEEFHPRRRASGAEPTCVDATNG